MKRIVLFVSIFGAGLLILVFALGPSRLWRHAATSSIQPQDLPPAPTAINLSTQGQRVSFGMKGAGTIPFWMPRLQPDGSTLRVKAAQLKYTNNEPYAGGVHLIDPLLVLYPAKQSEESAIARVTAAGGDLATRGDLRSLAESLKTQELREFTLAPDVRLEWLDAEGRPALTVETSRLEIPETPAAPEPAAGSEEEKPPPFPKLVAPNPVHIFQTDGGFNLNAAGFDLLRLEPRLELRGPLTLTATHFTLPLATAKPDEPAHANGPVNSSADAAAKRPPITLTCDGHATFIGKKADKTEKGAQPKGADASQLIGPGTLVFEKNVVVRQTDPLTHDERWLRTSRLQLELEQDPTSGQLTVTHFTAGSGAGTDVTFGLLGGEGSAHQVTRDGDDLVASGPVVVNDLHVGRGKEARVFSLAAQEKLVVHQEAAGPGVSGANGPARVRAELYGAAHATGQNELDADADHLTAILVKGTEAAAGDAAGSFDLDQLDLDGHARVDMHARGKANADKVTLRAGAAGSRLAHLEGDAVVTTDRGTLHGPTLDLDLPNSKEAPLHVTAPKLDGGKIALPAGASLFDAAGHVANVADPAKGEKNAPPRELRLEPIAPTRLEVVGGELHLRGRTTVRVFELPAGPEPHKDPVETQRVTADALDLVPEPGAAKGDAAASQLTADGDVEVVDLERNFHLLAAHAHTETAKDGNRHLLLDGAPGAAAKGTIDVARPEWPKGKTAELVLVSSHLDFDLVTKRIVADDPEHQVTAWIPEALVGTMLPSGFGVLQATADPAAATPADGATVKSEAPPEPPPLEFHADHVDVTPQELAAAPKPVNPAKAAHPPQLPTALAATATSDNPFMRALVTANGRIHALRKLDDSTFEADQLLLDLAIARARLDGSPGAPVKLLRPKPYAKDRVEQVITDWIEATEGGQHVTLAGRRDGPVIVLFPEHAPENGAVPKRMRVELQCSEPPVLTGNRLLLTGGVDTWLEIGDAKDPGGAGGIEKAHARSERVEVLLSGPLGDKELTLVKLNAQERVHLDFGDYTAEGARLTYDFAKGELTLKQGLEPCRLLAADALGAWHSTATFELMNASLLASDATHASAPGRLRPQLSVLAHELPRVRFKNFQLVAEGPRER